MSEKREEEIEVEVRALLGLPPCGCGEGLYCPEIALNMIGHANEAAVRELLGVDDAEAEGDA